MCVCVCVCIYVYIHKINEGFWSFANFMFFLCSSYDLKSIKIGSHCLCKGLKHNSFAVFHFN